MPYGATPLDGSVTPIPMPTVVPDGTSNPTVTAGGPSYTDSGNTKAPVAVWTKDGNDTTLGLTTQTKATDGSTTSWTVIQLLKGIFDRFINGSIAVTGTFWQATQPVSGTVTAQPGATTSGGSTPYHLMSAASTNATSLKGSAGQVYGFSFSNANAAIRYVKLYDKASAPTVGTDVPKMTVLIPATGLVARAFPVGLQFSLGIAFSTNTGIADADTGAVGANDLSIDIDYK